MRCQICGRLPEEECCEVCHRVERALERDFQAKKQEQALHMNRRRALRTLEELTG